MNTGYVLTLTETELTRYRRMAAWARRDESELWTSAGIVAGATVADVGCGPGAVTVELADVVGPEGLVIAVDQDEAALAIAREVVAQQALDNVLLRQGDADATGISPAGVDAVVIRHVLAHNGPRAQAIVDHAASLLRPGGALLVLDVDLTAQRMLPVDADLADLQDRYVELHRARGNDPTIGLRLRDLLANADLDVTNYRGWYSIVTRTPDMRPPAWIARAAIVAAGHADRTDVARWSAALDRQDTSPTPPTIFVSQFAAIGTRPN